MTHVRHGLVKGLGMINYFSVNDFDGFYHFLS